MNSSKFLSTSDRQRVHLICDCGDATHGGIQLRRDTLDDVPQVVISLWFIPASGFCMRLKQAWELLLGRAVGTDVLVNGASAEETANWLRNCARGGTLR